MSGTAVERAERAERAVPRPRAVLPWLAAAVALLVLGLALLGPFLAPHDPRARVGAAYGGPAPGLPLGTDALGRDVLSRVLCGGRRMVLTAGGATLLTSAVGGAAGVLAGLLPARVGEGVQRLFDVLAVVPPLLLVLVLAAGFPGSDLATVLAVVLATAPFSVRVLRAATTRVVSTGYVETARARGDGALRVARHDILPNLAGTALTEAGLRFVASLHLAATAGFLGLGGSGAAPDWGRMVSENLAGASLTVLPFLLPTLLLVTLAVCVGLLADRYAATGAR
ncbi:ABC transporter permease [Streptomyces sp. NEAU-H3]|uniref:ABC transporter permease n=1 Tax=Streptomyces sp. NEAU-H3 TaxID=2720636 RepID=UPI00143A2A92|nr:ABC transporter permease subunit [Streptomyces sp. NEAU-H3]NJA58764.1 ABC transporter permease subunit [Streptomyces sp. NEAU-H3]